MLHQVCRLDGHHFWPDDVSVRDALLPGAIITHAHVTDIYLLALAVHHDGRLATLDTAIPATAVRDGQRALVHIPA